MIEEQILGAILLSKNAQVVALSVLSKEYFLTVKNQRLFSAIKSVEKTGKEISPTSVDILFNDFNYISELTGKVITTHAIKQDCLELQDRWRKIQLQDKLIKLLKNKDLLSLNEFVSQIDDLKNFECGFKRETVRNLDQKPYKGLIELKSNYIPTGLPTIDHAINDLAPGCVTLITGRTNSGKSTLALQIMANAIDKGNKVFFVSGEGIEEIIINRLYHNVIGKDEGYYNSRKINKRYIKEPTKEALMSLKKWHEGKLTIFSKGESRMKSTEELFKLINDEIRTNKPNLIVIDNLMSVLTIEKSNDKLNAQGEFMQACCDMVKANNIHLILVLHPRKQSSVYASMEIEDISGTQDLGNKADNIILVKRNYKVDGINWEHGYISVLKNRYYSELPTVDVYLDEDTNMLLEVDASTKQIPACSFNWLKKNTKEMNVARL